MSSPSPLDSCAVEQAAEWLMRLSEGPLSDLERAQWQQWRRSHADCEQAWQRAERLLQKVERLPPALAMPTLDRPHDPQRRAALGRLAAWLAVAPLAWAGWQLNQREGWTADYRAAVGQRRDLTLADGSRLTLNTGTAVDVRFDLHQRLIVLRHGEILLRAVPDPAMPARALHIQTAQGMVSTQGGLLGVRDMRSHSQLVVLEGSAQVSLGGQSALTTVAAVQRTVFGADGIAAAQPADSSITAWTRGMLMADNMPLKAFVAELGRYGHGFVRCAPDIADLRVSGAFPLDDQARTLRMLARTYPVKIASHLDGLWVTLSPA